MTEQQPLTYCPGVFAVRTMEEARAIILTPEIDGTDQRWEFETGYLADVMLEKLHIGDGDVVLDFGCGIGRMAKELIERVNCSVIGVDISPSMRMLAAVYVNSDRFVSCSPQLFAQMIGAGLRLDSAFSVWVLQHCLRIGDDLGLIRASMKDGADLVVVNDINRMVPTEEKGWINDGLDIRASLVGAFSEIAFDMIDSPRVDKLVAASSFVGHYRKEMQ